VIDEELELSGGEQEPRAAAAHKLARALKLSRLNRGHRALKLIQAPAEAHLARLVHQNKLILIGVTKGASLPTLIFRALKLLDEWVLYVAAVMHLVGVEDLVSTR
jgi:hypothetical protein